MIEIEVNGEIIEFPDGMADADIEAVLQQEFGGQQAPAPAAPEQGPGLASRVTDALGEGISGAVEQLGGVPDTGADLSRVPPEITEAFGTPTTTPAERVQFAVGGELIPAVAEAFTDAAITGAKAVIPDDIEEAIINTSKGALDWLASTTPGRAGLAAARKGLTAYNKWSDTNPIDAQRLESVVNIATVLSPATPVTASLRTKVGEGVVAGAKKAGRQKRKDAIKDMIAPITLGGRDTKLSPAGVKTFVPDDLDQKVIEAVARVPAVSPSKAFTHNTVAIREQSKKLKVILDRRIEQAGNPAIDTTALSARLNNIADTLNDRPESFALTGDSRASAQKMIQQASRIINESDGTTLGILNSRRELDSWVRRFKPSNYDSNAESAISVANKFIRDELNRTVNAAVPDVKVSKLLEQQHLLLRGADKIENRAIREADTTIGRIRQNLEAKTGLRIPTTPIAAGLTVGALGTTAGAGAAVTLAGIIAAWKGGQMIFSPAGRELVGKMIRTIESDPTLAKTLRSDRLALVEMMKGAKDEDDPIE